MAKKNNNYKSKNKTYKNNTTTSNIEKNNKIEIEEDNLDSDTKEIIEEETVEDKKSKIKESEDEFLKKEFEVAKATQKKKGGLLTNFLAILLLISSLVYFGMNITNSSLDLKTCIINIFLTLFTILFVAVSITHKNKSIIFISDLLLLFIFGFSIFGTKTNIGSTNGIEDFRGKDLAYITKWASKNKIKINQIYEYNDMVDEYEVISQDVKAGTSIKDVKEITISVSEGPNPSKEIMVPSMISWDSERVINFVKENYLNNVNVEFVQSDKAKDTVIEQNTSGNLKRDDELKLTFSYGEELGYEEVSIIDLVNKSKFEAEFYMKQHQLNYKFNDEFSDKIKKGFVVKHNPDVSNKVKVNDEAVVITISKGPKIVVPDLTGYTMTDITEWAIKNKLKINFSDKYDDTIKENSVISSNYKKDDVVEQGTSIKIVLSRGPLKMPKFKSINDFYTWANKYEIHYEEKHEFSDSFKAGDVISFSYKAGEAIKNNDIITVTISDGNKQVVPNLIGNTKKKAISKLEDAGLNYNFVYKNSNEDKDIVIRQSMSAGSEVSSGVTITVTLSNGKAESNDTREVEKRETSNNNNNNNNNDEKPKEEPKPEQKPETQPAPERVCTSYTIRRSQISSVVANYQNCDQASKGLKKSLESEYPGLKVDVSCEEKDGYSTNDFISGFSGGKTDSCSSISITLAK